VRVVIDTNIVISALISSHGSPARIIDLIVLGRLTPVFDDRIMAEYREVLARPKFNFQAQDINALLDLFEAEGESIVALPLDAEDLPDSDDAPFLEVAITASCPLVTGNTKHFPEKEIGKLIKETSTQIMTPAELFRHEADFRKEEED